MGKVVESLPKKFRFCLYFSILLFTRPVPIFGKSICLIWFKFAKVTGIKIRQNLNFLGSETTTLSMNLSMNLMKSNHKKFLNNFDFCAKFLFVSLPKS